MMKRLWKAAISRIKGNAPPDLPVEKSSELRGPENTTTVLIIGAGSTGLALAQGLKKAGISCIVFEKHASLDAKSRDWNMALHWGAPALQSLIQPATWAKIQSVQVDPSVPTAENDTLSFYNAKSGDVMAAIPVHYFYRLRRRKLRALLADGVEVRYGKKLKATEYSEDGKTVTATFEDGTSATGRLIIGADGARSTLRQLLMGPQNGSITRLPYVATFVQARFTAKQALFLRKWHSLYLGGIHPQGFFSFFGIHDVEDASKPETWTFFTYLSWQSSLQEQEETADWTNEQRLKQVKEYAKDFAEPWKSTFEWLPEDQQVWYMGLTDYDPGTQAHGWDNCGGRVTFAGDAGHAMTYQRGQGLNHSITDAAKLTEAIKRFISGEEQQAIAVAVYEKEMIARAGEEVRMSTTNTEMVHDWAKVVESPLFKAGLKTKTDARPQEKQAKTPGYQENATDKVDCDAQ